LIFSSNILQVTYFRNEADRSHLLSSVYTPALPLCGRVPGGGNHRVDCQVDRNNVRNTERVAQHDAEQTFANLQTTQQSQWPTHTNSRILLIREDTHLEKQYASTSYLMESLINLPQSADRWDR